MEGPSQAVYRIGKRSPHPECKDVPEFPCWVCGYKSTRGMFRWKWSGQLFTGQNKARCPISDYVCEACAVVMSGKPPDTERMFSHFVEGDSWLRINKGKKPAMREFLRRSKTLPWFAAMTDAGQKHVIPWSPMNMPGEPGVILFEEQLVHLPDEAGWELVDQIADMLTDGATKEEALPGQWGSRAYSLLGRERIEVFEERWGGERGGSWFELAVWLAQRDEAKVEARMEREKAASAAKKAKAKEAERGGKQRGKGKASDVDRGGDTRLAKRVSAHARVQRDEALGPDSGPAPSGSEVVGESGGVVHRNATKPSVVESKQGQLGFVF